MSGVRVARAAGDVLVSAVLIGATSGGVIGGTIGLVVGLHVYPPTAPIAVLEAGIPATIVGGFVGLVGGALVLLVRRVAARVKSGSVRAQVQ